MRHGLIVTQKAYRATSNTCKSAHKQFGIYLHLRKSCPCMDTRIGSMGPAKCNVSYGTQTLAMHTRCIQSGQAVYTRQKRHGLSRPSLSKPSPVVGFSLAGVVDTAHNDGDRPCACRHVCMQLRNTHVSNVPVHMSAWSYGIHMSRMCLYISLGAETCKYGCALNVCVCIHVCTHVCTHANTQSDTADGCGQASLLVRSLDRSRRDVDRSASDAGLF